MSNAYGNLLPSDSSWRVNSVSSHWRAGATNLITDVPGLKVGNAACTQLKSGVTVLSADAPFIAGVNIMGGAPGTRDTELLAPDKVVEEIDALVLSGGSAFGLDAASGVADALRQDHRGFRVGPVQVPIVPAAIIFDLVNGGKHDWLQNPYAQLGYEAYGQLSTTFDLGSVGAGMGATTASLKGGLGSASLVLPGDQVVGALVISNPHGHVNVAGSRHFWAAPFEMDDEFGGCGVAQQYDVTALPVNNKFAAYAEKYGTTGNMAAPSPEGMNTTIAIVATNVAMNKSQLTRFAVAAQDGMARAIVPSHTLFDGDLVFSVSTAQQTFSTEGADTMLLGHAAAVCLSRAIARSVYYATSFDGDTLSTWQAVFGQGT